MLCSDACESYEKGQASIISGIMVNAGLFVGAYCALILMS